MPKNLNGYYRALDSVLAQMAQAAVSLLTTLTFVRLLSPTDFGILTAIWSIWMLLMSMNRTVFGEQLLAQRDDGQARHGYQDFGFAWATVGIALSVLIPVLTGAMALIPGLVCVAMFVVSDMVRYGEMARRDSLEFPKALLPVELVRLALSALAFAAVLLQLHPACSVSLALASSSIWIFLGIRLNGLPQLGHAWRFIRNKEKFEGLMVLQFLTGAGASQITPLLALHAFGAAQFGGIRLAQSLLSPMTLVTSAFQPTLIRFYASRKNSGKIAAVLVVTILGSAAIAACMTVLALWAIKTFEALVIPETQRSVVESILLPMVVLLGLVVVGQPGGALIKVLRMGGASFWGQAVGSCVTLFLCVVAAQQNIQAFVWALALGSASTVLGTYLLIGITLIHLRNRSGSRRVADGN
ncbi:UNVERIFIED_CONTAM: hypothetical protein Q9R71_06820 [Actinomycetes bacterium ARC8]|nr:hypothetical protein [Actinomycetes bacterium ARC8]